MLTSLLLLPTLAHAAAPPPRWQWSEGQARTWYIESLLLVPWPWTIGTWGEQDRVRTAKVRTQLIVTCTPVEQRLTAWDLSCDIQDAALAGATVDGQDSARLDPVMRAFADNLVGAEIQMVLGMDGTVRSLDLEGLAKDNLFLREAHEWNRQLLWRSMAGFDLLLPNGVEDSWTQRDSPWADNPYGASAPGAIRIKHERRGEDRTMEIKSRGRGTLTLGAAAAVNAALSVPTDGNTYSLRVASVATWDDMDGAMTERIWALVGEPTASAGVITGGPYIQGGYLKLLDPGHPWPSLDESGSWDAVWEPGPSDAALRLVETMEPIGYDPEMFQSEPYLWLQAGPSWHAVAFRDNVWGGQASIGVRLPVAFSVGGGVWADLDNLVHGLGWHYNEQAAYGGVWYESNHVVTPRVGVMAGGVRRSFRNELAPAPSWSPFVALDLSVMLRLGNRAWLGLHARAPYELRPPVIVGPLGREWVFDDTSFQAGASLTVKLAQRRARPAPEN